jgi:hypothetical protein
MGGSVTPNDPGFTRMAAHLASRNTLQAAERKVPDRVASLPLSVKNKPCSSYDDAGLKRSMRRGQDCRYGGGQINFDPEVTIDIFFSPRGHLIDDDTWHATSGNDVHSEQSFGPTLVRARPIFKSMSCLDCWPCSTVRRAHDRPRSDRHAPYRA